MNRHLSQGTRLTAVLIAGFLGLLVPSVHAQGETPDAPPAHVSFDDGTVVLERDGQTEKSPRSMPLLAGDRIRTEAGRAEILFADNSTLHLDHHTTVDFQSDEVVRLLEGRMRLNITGQGRDVAYRVDAPGGWVQIVEPGEFRIAVLRGEREPQVELAVLRGAAELVNEDGRSLVRAGERSFARAGFQPSPPYVFNSAAWDQFDHWSEARRDQRLGVSAQYLPPDVRPYSSTFDHYGSWRHEPVYGYVWYPRVTVGWRPYYHGRWVGLRPWGWTWIAHDPWGWPTHHYGRWGFSAGAWFWIPGRRWGPAWVSWAHAPGYISWCPLGWNDRPVFSFVNVNVFGGRRYDPWRAWTVVPRRHFGTGFVNVNVVSPTRFDHRTRTSFVVRDRGPEVRYAVPRASVAIRTAGTRTGYAIPRGSNTIEAQTGGSLATGSRGFPLPAREPRASSAARGSDRSSSAPITAAPERAVPRNRAIPREGISAPSHAAGGITIPGPRVRGQRSAPADSERGDVRDPATVPDSRAVPRRSPRPESPGRTDSDWGRYDRRPPVTVPSIPSTPESRPETGARPDAGYRRAPDAGTYGDRGRAVPRQDVPRPSYEAPRPGPRSSGGDAPSRSYGSPRGESQPRSYGAPARPSGPPPSAAPSRSAPSGDSGQSRSRGEAPSRGQATRRGGR